MKTEIQNSEENQHDDVIEIDDDIFSEIVCKDIGTSGSFASKCEESVDSGKSEMEPQQVTDDLEGTIFAELVKEGQEGETEFKLINEVIPSGSPREIASENNADNNSIAMGLNFKESLNLEGQIEALVFASPKPIKSSELLDIIQIDMPDCSLSSIEAILKALTKMYSERRGGFTLEYMRGEGYQFRTVECAAPLMERLFASRPRPLSRAAFETLAVIAYRQPVTRADIEYIRGVDAGSIIKNLLDRNLIQCVGRKEDAGRPMLFGTSTEFLRVFRLNALADLPPLSSFQPSTEVIKTANELIERVSSVDVEQFMSNEDDDGGGDSFMLPQQDGNSELALSEVLQPEENSATDIMGGE